jgi:Holliday junction resolvase RusA-like endonuclease
MIEIAVEPMGKPRMTQRDKWAKRKVVVRYFEYCDALRLALPGFVVPDRLVLRFSIAMPKSWSKKKRVLLKGKPHTQKPDIDNLAKAFMDALADDDSYIYSLTAEKYWDESGSIRVLTPELDGVIHSKGV